MTDEEVAYKLRLLLHFRGSGVATDKEYQELEDVNSCTTKPEYLNNHQENYVVADYGVE